MNHISKGNFPVVCKSSNLEYVRKRIWIKRFACKKDDVRKVMIGLGDCSYEPAVALPARRFSPAMQIFVIIDCENNQFLKNE